MEEVLAGGVDNVGAVVRVGDTVRRPAGPNAARVRRLLEHLERVGFEGAPRFRGVDDRGREVFDYIPGDVAVAPYPAWIADEDLLVDVARLQRELHAACRDFHLPDGEAWTRASLPPGAAGTLICHLDLCPENVVVREGRAAAFLDFDLAGQADPLFDIAIAARHWVPLRDPVDVADARAGADLVDRFGLFADAHRLDAVARDRLVGMLLPFLAGSLARMRVDVEAGHPGFTALWAEGYPDQNLRSRDWLARNRRRLAAGRPRGGDRRPGDGGPPRGAGPVHSTSARASRSRSPGGSRPP
jgi:hypothetical protein